MAERVLSLGAVEVPEEWEFIVEATLRAPAKTAAPAMLAARSSTVQDGPRPSVILQRRDAPKDAISFLEGFLQATVSASSGMQLTEDEELVFDDGTRARAFRVNVDTTPPLAQLHLCRVDNEQMTHFVLAAAASEPEALITLRKLVASW